MNRLEEFRSNLRARMAAIRTGGTASSFSRTAGMAAESSRGGNEIAGYLTPSREEVWQWWESVRGSMHVRMNDVYRNFAAGTEFFYVHDDDTINAFAGQSEDEKKPFQIVFFGGAMRFSRVASLAVAVDMCGRPGTASRFARSIDMNGMMSIRAALNVMSECGLDEMFSLPGVRAKAQAVSSGMIVGILAHEMGHVCLGHINGPSYYESNPEIARNHEREADSFASSITAACPFGEYVYEGTLFWHYVLAMQEGNEAVASTHPLSRERLENIIRANSSKASALGIRIGY